MLHRAKQRISGLGSSVSKYSGRVRRCGRWLQSQMGSGWRRAQTTARSSCGKWPLGGACVPGTWGRPCTAWLGAPTLPYASSLLLQATKSCWSLQVGFRPMPFELLSHISWLLPCTTHSASDGTDSGIYVSQADFQIRLALLVFSMKSLTSLNSSSALLVVT